jgi:DNA-binding GntR family transcriptional regulator
MVRGEDRRVPGTLAPQVLDGRPSAAKDPKFRIVGGAAARISFREGNSLNIRTSGKAFATRPGLAELAGRGRFPPSLRGDGAAPLTPGRGLGADTKSGRHWSCIVNNADRQLLTIWIEVRSVRGMAAGESGGLQAGEAARVHAFGMLRQAILSGDFAPGQRLIEEELAGTLGVTRQSLRAALLDLTAEGLVERIPNRGARVRIVTPEEAVAITECRMALEALCAAKAAERITDDEAAQLRELAESLKRAVADGNPLKYSELNRELHRRVGVFSGQTVAIGLLERLHAQLVRHQFQLALRPGRPEVSLAEHLAIADAVAGRRPQDADRAVRAHLASVIEALRSGDASDHHTSA